MKYPGRPSIGYDEPIVFELKEDECERTPKVMCEIGNETRRIREERETPVVSAHHRASNAGWPPVWRKTTRSPGSTRRCRIQSIIPAAAFPV